MGLFFSGTIVSVGTTVSVAKAEPLAKPRKADEVEPAKAALLNVTTPITMMAETVNFFIIVFVFELFIYVVVSALIKRNSCAKK